MKRQRLIEQTVRGLEEDSYISVTADSVHACFDILASKPGRKFAIKIVHNIDSVSKTEATRLNKLASFLDSCPLILGVRSNNECLKKKVTYSRFEINCVSVSSFDTAFDDMHTYIASKSVGVKVRISCSKLRSTRKMNGFTLNSLAAKAGIAASTLYKHEHSDLYASLGTVRALERILGKDIRSEDRQVIGKKSIYSGYLGKTDLSVVELGGSPFNKLAKSKNYYELCNETDSRTAKKKAVLLERVRDAFPNNYPFFLGSSKLGKIGTIPVLTARELSSAKTEDELLELVYS